MPLSRSEIMSRIRSQNTSPERALRSRLWKIGCRYRLQLKTPGGKPDLVFPKTRTAVFIDGCFWHGCPLHYIFPKTRQNYWRGKLQSNLERDRRQTKELEANGWTVLRVWEHEVCENLDTIVELIMRTARGNSVYIPDQQRLANVRTSSEDGEIEERTVCFLRAEAAVSVHVGPRVSKKWRHRLV